MVGSSQNLASPSGLHMNVHPGLFSREKVKSKATIAENCGTHGRPITRRRSVWHITISLSDARLHQRQTKALYPNHRLPPWPNEDAPRDRSNRLLDAESIAKLYANTFTERNEMQ